MVVVPVGDVGASETVVVSGVGPFEGPPGQFAGHGSILVWAEGSVPRLRIDGGTSQRRVSLVSRTAKPLVLVSASWSAQCSRRFTSWMKCSRARSLLRAEQVEGFFGESVGAGPDAGDVLELDERGVLVGGAQEVDVGALLRGSRRGWVRLSRGGWARPRARSRRL